MLKRSNDPRVLNILNEFLRQNKGSEGFLGLVLEKLDRGQISNAEDYKTRDCIKEVEDEIIDSAGWIVMHKVKSYGNYELKQAILEELKDSLWHYKRHLERKKVYDKYTNEPVLLDTLIDRVLRGDDEIENIEKNL